MQPDLTGILAIIVIFQLLFVAALLFTYPRGRRLSNRLFALFFLAVCLNFTDGYLILKNAYVHFPSFAFIGNNFSLLFGPLLYLYARSIIYRDFRLQWQMGWHALPFLLFLGFSVYSYHLQPTELQLYILQSAGNLQYPGLVYAFAGLIYAQFFTYGIYSLRLIQRYRSSIRDSFSATGNINLNWLIATILLFMAIIGIGLLNTIITVAPLEKYYPITLLAIMLAIFLFINRVLFRAIRQPEMFEGISSEQPEAQHAPQKQAEPGPMLESPAPATRKYADSTLTDVEKEAIRMKLLEHMEVDRPYLQPELTLEQLAAQLSVKPRILSRVINECLGQNFFDFINRYRISDAQRLLSNPADKKITVLEVLYEVGFNSKSSFNTLFRKYTGTTPSAFKRQHMQ